jgi:phosphatidylglycerophosphate synthase
MRIAELRRRVQPPTNNVYDTVFTRRFSILVTAALAPLGTTANQVTVANLLVGFAACLLIAFTDNQGVVAGVILLHVYAILDSVDGELARLRRQFSLKGLYLEDLSAFFMIVGFPLAVGVHIHRAGSGPEPLVLAILYAAFGRNSMAVARRAILRSVRTKRPVESSSARQEMPSYIGTIRRVMDEHLLNHTNIRLAVSTAFLVEVLAGGPVTVTTWLMSAVLIGLLAREAAAILYLLRGHRLDTLLAEVYEDAKIVHTDPTDADGFRLARY